MRATQLIWPRSRWSLGEFAVRLPKVESPVAIDAARAVLGERIPITALIETALGLEAAAAIAAHPAVTSVGLGEADLASDLGSADNTVLDWARVRTDRGGAGRWQAAADDGGVHRHR